jgi:hypothetical protein
MMMMKWTYFASIWNTGTTSFTLSTFHCFIHRISIDYFGTSLNWSIIDPTVLLFCCVFLFFLVNDSMRVLPSFPDRWLIRRGTPSLPRSEAQRLLPWRRHLRTELLLLWLVPTSEHQKKCCLNPLRRFQTRVPRHTIVRFSIQKCTDRWFSIRFVWDLRLGEGWGRSSEGSARVGRFVSTYTAARVGGGLIHKSIVKRNMKRAVWLCLMKYYFIHWSEWYTQFRSIFFLNWIAYIWSDANF